VVQVIYKKGNVVFNHNGEIIHKTNVLIVTQNLFFVKAISL
jgi:hypothetical protein